MVDVEEKRPDSNAGGLRGHMALGLLLVLLVVFIALVVALYVTHTTTKVQGGSMRPGFIPEDIILVTRGYDRALRGDVVVLTSPRAADAAEPLVKRVIAIGGDEVSVVDGQAFVNGSPETGAYTVYVAGGDINVSRRTVPEGSVYVLGDNRPVSQDSRIIGPVPLELVQGRVVAIIAPIHRMAIVD